MHYRNQIHNMCQSVDDDYDDKIERTMIMMVIIQRLILTKTIMKDLMATMSGKDVDFHKLITNQ